MIRIEVGGERWEVDDDFLASGWTCIWGRGCQGIDVAPDPSGTLGCCILGAELTDVDDAANVAAHAACLDEGSWQHARDAASDGIFTDETRRAIRVVDGACIFLNRDGFAAGPGCALHLGAAQHGEPPLEWKPNVCWQLPLKVERHDGADGTPVHVLRRWRRDDFGGDDASVAWFCTDTADALVGDAPAAESLASELAELLGDDLADAIRDRVDQRRRRDSL